MLLEGLEELQRGREIRQKDWEQEKVLVAKVLPAEMSTRRRSSSGGAAVGEETPPGTTPKKMEQMTKDLGNMNMPNNSGASNKDEDDIARGEQEQKKSVGGGKPPRFTLSPEELDNLDVKIVDVGNACWTYKQFTSDIQTRQYRSPEGILGTNDGDAGETWEVACGIFELVTG